VFNCSNFDEGTALASAANAGKDQVVAHLLSIGASVNGSIDRHRGKVTMLNLYS